MVHGEHTVWSATGVHQGDPTALGFWALGAHEIIEETLVNGAANGVAPSLVMWDHDDGTLCGSSGLVMQLVEPVTRENTLAAEFDKIEA